VHAPEGSCGERERGKKNASVSAPGGKGSKERWRRRAPTVFDGAGEDGERGEGGDGGVHVHGERGPVGARMETGERLTGELRNR